MTIQPVRLAAELFVIPLEDGHHLVYAPFRRSAFVANNGMLSVLARMQAGEDLSALDSSIVEFLRRLEILSSEPDPIPNGSHAGDPMPTSCTLFLTTACNLRCTYCYASAGDTPVKYMPLEIAKRGIDFILGNALRRQATEIEVAYHGGGEPAVNWRVLTESFAYAQQRASEHGLVARGTLASNGVLNDRQIDWILQHLDGASISFDGLPEMHDRHRLTVLGQGSSAAVMRTLSRFDAAAFRYGVRITATADQLASLPEAVDFICSRFRPARIQIEPAFQLGRWSGAPSAETQEFIDAYRQAQQRAFDYGREIHYSAAHLDQVTPHFCGVTQDLFALSPDGNVSACYEVFSEDNPLADHFFYGSSAADGFRFQLPVLNNLRRQTVNHRAHCQGCFAKWHCAGDCHHKALRLDGGEFHGTDRCAITRELTKDLLLAKIARAGGHFWHEPPSASSTRPGGKENLL